MKKLIRFVAVAAVVSTLALTQAFAGDCCKKAAGQAKAGKACDKCLTEQCCKDAAAKVAKNGKAKDCAKCAAAAKKDEKKS